MSKGLSREEAEKLIPYGQEDYLTIEQLRIKFDNPDLGKKYPEWLQKEDHMKMCFKTAKDVWNSRDFGWFCTPEELATKLYIWSSIRLNKFNSYPHLKTGLMNATKNILRDEVTKETMKIKDEYLTEEEFKERHSTTWNKKRYDDGTYISSSLDQCAFMEHNSDGRETLHSRIPDSIEAEEEQRSVINQIRSIRNKQVKQFLIVGGFLLANISELEVDFQDIIDNSDVDTAKGLKDLYTRTIQYEEMMLKHKYDGTPIDKDIKKIVPKDIVSVIGTKSFGDIKSTGEVISQIRQYLVNTSFCNMGFNHN